MTLASLIHRLPRNHALALCCLLTPLTSQAWINLGDAGQIDLLLTSSLTYDSNIQGRSNELDDFIARGSVALRYQRPSRRVELGATLGVRASRYFDQSQFDQENIFFDVTIRPTTEMRNSRFSIESGLVLDSRTETDLDVGEIVTTRRYGANLEIVYRPNRQYTVSGTAAYTRINPDSNLPDTDQWSIGLSLQRPFSESLNLVGGVNYGITHVRQDRTRDQETVSGYVGFNGRITPKLNASVQGGASVRMVDNASNSTIPYLRGQLTWQLDDLSQITAQAGNRFGSSLDGSRTETFDSSITATRQMTRRLSANMGIHYNRTDYSTPTAADRKSVV